MFRIYSYCSPVFDVWFYQFKINFAFFWLSVLENSLNWDLTGYWISKSNPCLIKTFKSNPILERIVTSSSQDLCLMKVYLRPISTRPDPRKVHIAWWIWCLSSFLLERICGYEYNPLMPLKSVRFFLQYNWPKLFLFFLFLWRYVLKQDDNSPNVAIDNLCQSRFPFLKWRCHPPPKKRRTLRHHREECIPKAFYFSREANCLSFIRGPSETSKIPSIFFKGDVFALKKVILA